VVVKFLICKIKILLAASVVLWPYTVSRHYTRTGSDGNVSQSVTFQTFQ